MEYTTHNKKITDSYSDAGGYGFWCGKKCAARKAEEGKRPNFGKSNKAAFDEAQEQKRIMEEQAAAAAAAAEAEQGGGGSKMPLIIGGVLVVGIIVTVVIVKMRKK